MNNWHKYIFFIIGWIGGIIMATVDGLVNKLIVLGVTMIIYTVAIFKTPTTN